MIAAQPTTTTNLLGPDSSSPSKRWGFAIYRCDYSDDVLWQSYMYYFKHSVKAELKDIGAHWSIWGRLHWTIIEDHKCLHSASKEDVQELFASLNKQDLTIQMPAPSDGGWRCKQEHDSCIYVDKWCLDTLDLHEAWLDRGAPGPFLPVVCAVLNKRHAPDNEAGLEGQPMDTNHRPYTGWFWTHVGCISKLCPSMIQRHPPPAKPPPTICIMPCQHDL